MSITGVWRAFRAFYITHPTIVTYMLQSTEYQVGPYLKWYWRTQNFAAVMHRRTLNPTRRARLVRMALMTGMGVQAVLGLSCLIVGLKNTEYVELTLFGAALLVSYPVVWAHLITVPLLAVKWLVVTPKDRRLTRQSEAKFSKHPAVKIAVAGSYGKTTMKEILAVVLAEGKKVAATPANKNVSVSHAQFIAAHEDGDEAILIIEYGEGEPGDIARFARTTKPSYGLITGLAPAHLDKYKTLEAAAEDIFSLSGFVDPENIYVNADSISVEPYLKPAFHTYSHDGVDDWRIDDVRVEATGTSFTLHHGKTKLRLHSGLLGRHQVGPLAAAAVLGLRLGLTEEQVTAGIAKTVPFEHRMQSYQLHGAWIIDDTYNGNLDGIRAGTALLKELDAKRKWYVTPGLVDQGKETAAIHQEVGRLIAGAKPDIVVLMQNSVTKHIQQGLQEESFEGEIRVEADPLAFYTNLDQFVTAGDVVLMQNDWTDNYA